MKYIFTLIILFLIIFNFKFKGIYLSPLMVLTVIASIWFCAYFASCYKSYKLKINKSTFALIVFGVLLLLSFVITTLISAHFSSALFLIYIKFFYAYPVISFFIVSNFINLENAKKEVYWLLITVFLVQACLAMLMILLPTFRELILGTIQVDENQVRLQRSLQYRAFGVGASYFGLTTAMTLGFMLVLFYQKSGYLIKIKQKILLSLAAILFLIIGLFSGRSMYVGGGVCIGVYLFCYLRPKISKRNARQTLLMFMLVPVVILLFMLILPDSIRSHVHEFYDKAVPWLFEPFLNYMHGYGLETSSTNTLMQMYKLPSSIGEWIFGDGRWFAENGTSYYMGTDAGYIRQLFANGLLGLIIIMSLYVYLLYRIHFLFGIPFVICFAALNFVFHIKGNIIYSGGYAFITVFLFIVSTSFYFRKKRTNSNYHV